MASAGQVTPVQRAPKQAKCTSANGAAEGYMMSDAGGVSCEDWEFSVIKGAPLEKPLWSLRFHLSRGRNTGSFSVSRT